MRARHDRDQPDWDGVLVIDKAEGPTSHDVVAAVRRVVGQRRVGHAGTLDPFATGVLVTCLGRATRLSRYFTSCEKTYEGVVRFGFATDTLDRTGRPLAEPVPVRVEEGSLTAAMAALTGELLQVPPMYSAKKRDGVALHRLARRGEEVSRVPVPVTVHAWDLLEVEPDRARFRVTCSAGTYVRVLAADLGERLGFPAHLDELRRLKAGPFSLERALPAQALDRDAPRGAAPEVARNAAQEATRDALIRLDDLPPFLPAVHLADEAAVLDFRHGRGVASGAFHADALVGEGDAVTVRDVRDALLGVARLCGGSLAAEVVLVPANGPPSEG